nr:DUF2637 domain-containing protein [Actinoplanes siamensis]
MLKAIDSVKRYNRATLIGALITSYLHQAHYLAGKGAGLFAYLPPAIFDTAMVSMLIVVRTPGIVKDAKRWAMAVFIGAALLSATVNFAAPGDLGMRIVFALVVVLVIGVELVAGRIRPDFTAIDKQAADLMTAVNKIKANNPTATPEPAHTNTTTAPAPATGLTPVSAEQPAASQPVPEAPAHLLPTARFSIVQHEQTTGQPITADELALRLNITPAVAASLIATIRATNPTTARINGNTPTLTGGAR